MLEQIDVMTEPAGAIVAPIIILKTEGKAIMWKLLFMCELLFAFGHDTPLGLLLMRRILGL